VTLLVAPSMGMHIVANHQGRLDRNCKAGESGHLSGRSDALVLVAPMVDERYNL
jgi:hypothetical protein